MDKSNSRVRSYLGSGHNICDGGAMKPMTEEDRQALIGEILEFLNNNTFMRETLQKRVYEIALASLTAEPVGSITSVTCINGGQTEARVYMRESGVPNTLGDVYTAPPVPVIKLPPVEKWKNRFSVRAQIAYKKLVEKEINGIS